MVFHAYFYLFLKAGRFSSVICKFLCKVTFTFGTNQAHAKGRAARCHRPQKTKWSLNDSKVGTRGTSLANLRLLIWETGNNDALYTPLSWLGAKFSSRAYRNRQRQGNCDSLGFCCLKQLFPFMGPVETDEMSIILIHPMISS